MEDSKKINAPEGEVNEKELQELADAETPEGGSWVEATIAVTALLSEGFCPTLKCTSKCQSNLENELFEHCTDSFGAVNRLPEGRQKNEDFKGFSGNGNNFSSTYHSQYDMQRKWNKS